MNMYYDIYTKEEMKCSMGFRNQSAVYLSVSETKAIKFSLIERFCL